MGQERQQDRGPGHGAAKQSSASSVHWGPGPSRGCASTLFRPPRGGAVARSVPSGRPRLLGFALSVRGTAPWWPLQLLPWPHGSV